MGRVRITNSDAILIDAIEGDEPMRDHLMGMWPGQTIDLEVAGTVARWERVQIGPSEGVRPVEAAENAWAVLRSQAGVVEIQPFPTATRLATFEERLHRWDTPQNRIY